MLREFARARTAHHLVAALLVAMLVAALLAVRPGAVEATPAPPDSRASDCTITGTAGADVLVGGPTRDVICGRGGPDRLVGGGGNDELRGGAGRDLLLGRNGRDELLGGGGADTLRGHGDGDRLLGGRGDDSFHGGSGNDTLLALDSLAFRDVLGCGGGGADRAFADPPDVVAASCEDVTQNDPPTDLTLTPSIIDENEPAGTEVGELTATDPDSGDTHVFALVAGEGATDNGSFSVDGSTLRTAESFDFEVDDALSVRIRATDAAGAAYEESLSITVADVQEDAAPVAVNDDVTVSEDAAPTSVAVLANDTDADGGPKTISSATDPAHGTVLLTGGSAGAHTGLTYQPDPDYCNSGPGPDDTFTYTLNGGSSATVSVTVTCVDDLPVAVADAVTVSEDAAAAAVAVLSNDSDSDGGPRTITSASDPAHGTVVVTGGGAGLTYQPDPGYCNSGAGPVDSFTYTLNGGSTATVSVTVTCADDAPVAVADAATVLEDAAAAAVAVLVNDTDSDGGPKTITSVSDPAHGAVVITGGGSGLTYAPAANYCNAPPGTSPDTFTYTLNGGSTATVSMTVTCADDAPVAVADAVTVSEDAAATAVGVLANDTDVDGGPKTITSVSGPGNGAVVITGGGSGLTYEPDPNYCNDPPGPAPGDAPDIFTYSLNGGSTATVSVTVACVDDAPVAVDDTATVSEDASATTLAVLANDTDVDGGPMTVTSASDPAHGAVVVNGGGTALSYQPDPNYCNSGADPDDTFTYTVSGGDTATVAVTVTCVDDAPVAVNDSFNVIKDAAAAAVPVLANDTDVDGGSKTIASASDPGNGTVAITGGGSGLTYQPDASYCNDPPGTALDTFTYTLNGGSTATVTVSVFCDAPPAAVNDSATVSEDASATAVDVLANDTDVDGGPMSIVSATDPANGTVVVTGGGSGLTYGPDANYCNDPPGSSPDTFTYTLNGGSTATVSVTVTCVDDLPTAVDDAATVLEDAAATAVPVLTNDTDVDGGTISIGSATDPTNGTVVITGGGSGVTYQPDANYCNSGAGPDDTFTYTLNGGSTATVSMTVTCVNDAPIADDETFNGNDSAIGNTLMVVDDPTDGVPVASGPRTSVTGSILTGDTDVDGPGPLTVTPGTFATNDGGSVTIQTDGDFTFQPAASTSCTDTSDFFDYTLEDSGAPELTDTGRVTIALAGCVWYVSNNAAGNAGTSAQPFDTLVQAETASGSNHTVFVYDGDNTSAGYATGFQMNAGERLIGEHEGLVVDPDGPGGPLTADTLLAAVPGAKPTITATNEDVVSLDDGNEVRGFVLDPAGTGGGIGGETGDTGGATLDDLDIIDTETAGTQPALELDGTTGTFTISNLVVSTSAVGVRLNNAGTAVFSPTGQISVTSTGARALDLTGTALGTSTFDTVTVTGSGSGGVSMVNTTGTTTFTDLALTTTSGATGAFVLSNAGTVTVSAAGTANVSATGGPAVDVTGTTGAILAFDDVDSTGSTGDGINLAGMGSGTFTAGTGSVVTLAAGSTGVGFDLDGGSGDVTYGGTVTASNAGRSVEVSNRAGGTVDFNGLVTDNGTGVRLTTNTTGTVRFDGGLVASTGASGAFSATGSGTVVVTDPNAVGTAPDNTLTTTTGIALNVNSVTIGSGGLNFRSISSNGATNGISLVSTGSAGGLTVTGTGAAGTGGTIQSTTSDSIVLTSTRDVDLRHMNLTDSAENGINGSSVTGLDLTGLSITGSGDDSDDVGVRLANLWGTSAWSNLSVTGSELANVLVGNTSGTLDALDITGASHFDDLGTAFGGNSVLIEISGTAVMTRGSIDGATFQDNKPARGITVQAQGSGRIGDASVNGFVVRNSTFTNNGLHASFEQSGTADLTFSLLNNGSPGTPMTMPNTAIGTSHAVNVFSSSNSTAGTIRGRISGNVIGNSGVAGSGSAIGNGIRGVIQGKTVATLLVADNVIRQVPQARGIDLQFLGPLDASGVGSPHDVTVTGNDVNPQDSTGFPASAIYVAADSQGGGTVTLRSDIRLNTVPLGAAVDALPTFLVLDEVAPAAVCQLVDTAPASANATLQLTETNTGTASAAAGCALFAGPVDTPP